MKLTLNEITILELMKSNPGLTIEEAAKQLGLVRVKGTRGTKIGDWKSL